MGASFAGAAYGYSTGSVLFDPALPVEDADSNINIVGIGYSHIMSNFGRQARFDVTIPYGDGDFAGIIDNQFEQASRSGFADPSVQYSINLYGAPPLSGEAFLREPKSTRIGAGVQVFLPLGEYREDRLANLGTNRFTVRPQLGLEHWAGNWVFEMTGSVWLFTDNDEFFNGRQREQDPLYALQAHAVYNFKPGLWATFGAGYGKGAKTTVDGVARFDEQTNSRLSFGLGMPLSRYQTLRFLAIRGRTKKIGGDFSRFAVSWSVMWGGGV